MEVPTGVKRVQAHHLPKTKSICGKTACVYSEQGVCDNPWINKGNYDAKCHSEPNAKLLARLEVPTYELGGQVVMLEQNDILLEQWKADIDAQTDPASAGDPGMF